MGSEGKQENKAEMVIVTGKKLGLLLLLLAFLISLHQYVLCGEWFEIKDIHHELFIVAFAFSGVLLLYLRRKRIQ